MSSFSLADLCDLADVTPRTVRFYVAQGLLRPPTGAGPAARYDEGHLYRLRLIRRLQKEHLPLAEIRRRLDALADPDVARLATEPASVMDSATDYVARVLGTKGIAKPTWGVPPTSSAPPASMAPSSPAQVGPPMPPLGPDALPAPFPSRAGRRVGQTSLALPASPSEPSAPTVDAVRSQWERISLTPDIELHIRRPLSRHQNRHVDRLLEAAREILTEVDE